MAVVMVEIFIGQVTLIYKNMIISELREFINKLSREYDNFELFDGKIKQNEDGGEMYRVDDSITMIFVDKVNKELVMLTQEIDE